MDVILGRNVTAEDVMVYVRGQLLIPVIATVLLSQATIFVRSYYFPAGVFRLDDEKESIRELERSLRKIKKRCMWLLITIVVPAVLFPRVHDVCFTENEDPTMGVNIRASLMCRLVRNYSPSLDWWKTHIKQPFVDR